MGMTVAMLRGRWQATMTVSFPVLQLYDVIIYETVLSNNMGLRMLSLIRVNVIIEICTQICTQEKDRFNLIDCAYDRD